MILPEQLSVGLLLWWTRNGYGENFSCPAIVTEIGDTWFKVRQFDTLVETGKLPFADESDNFLSPLKEMRSCSTAEARIYCKLTLRAFLDKIDRIDAHLQAMQLTHSSFKGEYDKLVPLEK